MDNKTSIRNIIAKNIKKYRKLNNLTQASLAEIADVSNTYIANIECGQTWISDKTLEKIAFALHVEPYLFFIQDANTYSDKIKKEQEKIEFINKKQEEFISYTKSFISDTIKHILGE